MRLPFGLGRRSGSADGASSDGSTAPATPVGASGPPSTPTRAWASLPAIQRTAGEMPLVAAPSHFVETLPGAQGLPPIVEPLGHEVSPLATPGLVVARTRAVEAPAPGAIPAPAPVQRRSSRGASGTDAAGESFEAFQDGVDAGTAVEGAAPPVAPTPASVPATAPIRTMPTVSRQAVRVPDRPLTSAAAAAQPAPVQRAAASAGPAPAAATGTPALPRPSGGMRRVPSPAPTVPQVSREVAESQPTAAAAAAPTSPAGKSSGPIRHGLGEPLTSAPATAKPVSAVLAGPVVSRTTTSGPLPIAASSLRPVAQRSAASADELPALEPGGTEPQSNVSAAPLPQPVLRLPHLPVSRSVDAGAPAPVTTGATGPSAPAARGPEVRPTTGANPLRPSLGIQRLAADDLDDGGMDAELPSPWWSPAVPAPSPDVVRSAPAPDALGAPVSAAVQRSAALDGESAAPARVLGSPRAGRGSQTLMAGRSAPVAANVQRSIAQTAPTSPLPQAAGAGLRSASSAIARPEAGMNATAAPIPVGVLGAEPVVQTSPATAAPPPAARPTSNGGAPAVQREEGSAPAAPSPTPSGAPSERELDELAQALFGRIRGRLRNDLIYDREAKGLTFDNV